jgi:extradiol dioxygenase family protein
LVTHQVDASQLDAADTGGATNKVEGHDVPASHFGIVMTWEDYQSLLTRLTDAGIEFVIDHHVRFDGRRGEQAAFFLRDPSGNHLEFKAFRNIEMLFAKDLENY